MMEEKSRNRRKSEMEVGKIPKGRCKTNIRARLSSRPQMEIKLM